MKKRTVAIAAALALVGAAPVTSANGSSPTAHASCTQARIAGQSKCIARGQFCSRTARAMRDYRRYGYSCTKRDRNGRYHLQ
jgi:predicted outer membrane protein